MNIADVLGAPVHDHPDSEAFVTQPCTNRTNPTPDLQHESPRASRVWVTLAVIGTLILGLAGGWVLASARQPAATPTAPPPPTAMPAQVTGAAELFTAMYLTGTASADDLAALYVGSPPQASGMWVNHTAAVSGFLDSRDIWQVIVAVDSLEPSDGVFAPADLRYFVVPISTADGHPVAVAAPARVPAPSTVSIAASFTSPVPVEQVAVTTRVIEQYLTGGNDIVRYIATPNSIELFTTPPYESVDVSLVGSDSLGMVKAAVDATDSHGATHSLEYALTLTFDDGVWEVASIGAATG